MQLIEFEIKASTEFVVMASDGLWDVVTAQECVNFVRRQLYEHGSIDRAAQEMLAKAMARGSSDNISILICCFNQAFPTLPEAGAVGGVGALRTQRRPSQGPQCNTH